MNGDRVLVTGSSGLIGEPLLESLRNRSFEAHGATRVAATDPLTHRADLAEPEQTAALLARVQPSVIIHLAGGQQHDVGRLYESNVLTTVNLLQAAARLETPPAFITTGSAAEYGEPANGIASESTAADPVTDYGRAKLASSALAQILSTASGIRLCIVRPFNVVSPHLPSATALGNMRAQLLGQTGRNRVVRCGRLDVIRDFVPIEFVVSVVSRLLELNEWPARPQRLLGSRHRTGKRARRGGRLSRRRGSRGSRARAHGDSRRSANRRRRHASPQPRTALRADA